MTAINLSDEVLKDETKLRTLSDKLYIESEKGIQLALIAKVKVQITPNLNEKQTEELNRAFKDFLHTVAWIITPNIYG